MRDTTTYHVAYILPAMTIGGPITCGPVLFCTSRHLGEFTIEPLERAALSQIAAQCRKPDGGALDEIGLALMHTENAPHLDKIGVPRMCRDALALSHITQGTARCCNWSDGSTVHNADYFDTLPVRLRGHGFVVVRPGLQSTHRDLKRCGFTQAIHLPGASAKDFACDNPLICALGRVIDAYIRGQNEREAHQIFRAIAVALHGARIVPEIDSTFADLGIRVVSWVAAFESLIHPGNGKVGKKEVLDLISRLHVIERQQSRTRCSVATPCQKAVPQAGERTQTQPDVLVDLYSRLYVLRNKMAHGNPFRESDFAVRVGVRDGPRIDEVAPLLFREYLLERLREVGFLKRAESPDEHVKDLVGKWDVRDALEIVLLGREDQ